MPALKKMTTADLGKMALRLERYADQAGEANQDRIAQFLYEASDSVNAAKRLARKNGHQIVESEDTEEA